MANPKSDNRIMDLVEIYITYGFKKFSEFISKIKEGKILLDGVHHGWILDESTSYNIRRQKFNRYLNKFMDKKKIRETSIGTTIFTTINTSTEEAKGGSRFRRAITHRIPGARKKNLNKPITY